MLALLAAGLLWSEPEGAFAEVRNPTGVAVIIGIRTYEHERVPEVSYAHRDAAAFRRYVVEVLGYDEENIIELLDASQAALETAFGNERSHEGTLWRYLDPEFGSDVVVFYSGHGVPGLNDGRGYLLPRDADPNTAEINGYPIDVLYENLGRLEEARSVTVYLDACFSGDSHEGMLVRSASPVYIQGDLPGVAAEKLTVLTAASGTELASWDEEAEHGLFTEHLLEALYGKGDANGDGRVTAEEAVTYLRRHMTRAARRVYGRHQHATLNGMPGAVLSSAVAGLFPARPVLGAEGVARNQEVAPAAATASKDEVQRDLLLLAMKEANAAGEHDTVLEYVAGLERLGGELPLEARYYRLQAFVDAGRNQEAIEELTRYLEDTGRGGKHYEEALQILLKLTQRLAEEDEAYESAKGSGTAAAYGEYLRSYPNGRYAEEARRQQGEAQNRADDAAYAQAQEAATASAYAQYLREYPSGRHAAEARRKRGEAQNRADDAAFARAQEAATASAYAQYLHEYPSGRHAAEARRKRGEAQKREDHAAYARAQRTGTAAAYAEYLKKYPAGRNAAEARRLERELRPGRKFRDCEGCPEMVVVPAGSFMMGSPATEELRQSYEGPPHRVTIPKPFAVGVYEVTFDEWYACLRDGGCGGYRPGDEGWGRGRRPVINVSWINAQAYVRWLSRETGEEYRLLSESEWEYAARAGTRTPFHFGKTISTSQANYNGNYTYGNGKKGVNRGRSVAVGTFSANRFGLYDVHGNVIEWVQDCWNVSYMGAPSDGSAWERGDCTSRVVRSGGFFYDPSVVRSAFRLGVPSTTSVNELGFRVARALTS